MKYFGSNSLSSIINKAINFIWYTQLIVFTVVLIGVLVGVSSNVSRSYRWPVTISQKADIEINAMSNSVSNAKVIVTNGELLFSGNNNRDNVVITFVALALIFGTVLLITFQLKKIFSTFKKTEPFVVSNSKRIRLIGIILIGSCLLKFLFGIFYTRYLNAHFQWDQKIIFGQSLDLGTIFIGVLVIILAQVFRLGTELQEDNNLTI